MNIYEYYMSHQCIKLWYDKFQSTSGKQSGKTFSYMNTNFRFIRSFLVQFDRFRAKIGKERKDWNDRLRCGQETDKHRITNLLQAAFISNQESYYYITSKGLALADLIDIEYEENDKWFLLFLLLLDYKTPDRNLDIIYTTKNLIEKLKKASATEEYINNELKELLHVNDKTTLFKSDLFWLITFSNDEDFISLFLNSNDNDKQMLKDHVISCSNNQESEDLIAHKFKSSGVYSGITFNDDIKVIYFVIKLLNYVNDPFDLFIEKNISEYKRVYFSSDTDKIKSFILDHKSIYIKVKQNLMGGLN